MTSVAVIGGGHNGLVCATFLALAGLDVTVFEANETAGGCVWTDQLGSGHRLERGAIDHGPILDIAEELNLARFGLEYIFRDVVAGAGYGDGASLVFREDLEETLEGLRGTVPKDVEGYRSLARIGSDLLAMMGDFESPPSLADIAGLGGGGAIDPLQLLLASSDKVVGRHVTDPHLTSALTMYGAHSQLPPWLPGTGIFGLILAGSHGHGAGRPKGGSIRLIQALVAAFESAGGSVRTESAVDSVKKTGDAVIVTTSSGTAAQFTIVVSTLDAPRTVGLLGDPPRDLVAAASMATSGSLNVAELKVDLALSAPASPGRFGHEEAIWMLQPEPGALARSFGEIVAGRLPSAPSMMWAAPSALDPTAAPDGGGSVWVSAFVPARLAEGAWTEATEAAAAEWMLDGLGAITHVDVRDDIVDMRVTGPASWQKRIGARFGNPNHIDMTIDQLFSLRPPTGSGYRTGVPWLYLSGAGTYPGGGLSGVPGRNAAMAVLGDMGKRQGGLNITSEIGAMRRGWRLFRTLRGRP